MSRLRDCIDAELENMESSLVLLPPVDQLPYLNALEQAGIAGLLHSFYNGVENILKQIVRDRGLLLPVGPSWHRDLLLLVAEQSLLPAQLVDKLKVYMAFRHFFSHAYVLDVDPARMEPLVADLHEVFELIRSSIQDLV